MQKTKDLNVRKFLLFHEAKMLVKTIKVSQKGQIAIPADIRRMIGISKGDSLIMLQDDGKILLEKSSERLKDDFKDLLKHSEAVAKGLWRNKQDDVWDKI
jgi:AbrB family looped-hinge helix DNA binding protein